MNNEFNQFSEEIYDENIARNGIINRILALIYVISIYGSLIGSIILIGQDEEVSSNFIWILLAIPVVIWICSLIFNIKNYRHMDRYSMFDAAMIMKYLMIPLFLVGGFLTLFMAMLTFIPVVFMAVLGPTSALVLSVIGWVYMVSGIVFSIPYLLKSRAEHVNGIGSTILGIICQFFMFLDVIFMMVMTFREERWKKVTIALLLIVAAVIILAFVSLFAGIMLS